MSQRRLGTVGNGSLRSTETCKSFAAWLCQLAILLDQFSQFCDANPRPGPMNYAVAI